MVAKQNFECELKMHSRPVDSTAVWTTLESKVALIKEDCTGQHENSHNNIQSKQEAQTKLKHIGNNRNNSYVVLHKGQQVNCLP